MLRNSLLTGNTFPTEFDLHFCLSLLVLDIHFYEDINQHFFFQKDSVNAFVILHASEQPPALILRVHWLVHEFKLISQVESAVLGFIQKMDFIYEGQGIYFEAVAKIWIIFCMFVHLHAMIYRLDAALPTQNCNILC